MRSTGAVITEIVETYNNRTGWMRISEITGVTREELAEAITELMDDEDFRAEPAATAQQITDADRELAPMIGGEARHMIRWA